MRRLLGLALTAFAVAALLAMSAGQALASHVRCGDVITQDTRLDSDLECTAENRVIEGEGITLGLEIGADDITLDLNGHEISGDGADLEGWDTGIFNGGDRICCFPAYRGVTIRNGRIRDFSYGVSNGGDASSIRHLHLIHNFWGLVSRGDDVRIEGNSSVDATGQGLVLDGARNTIRRNVVRGSDGAGIHAGAFNSLIEHNVSTDNDYGIRTGTSASIFRANLVARNGYGFSLEESEGTSLVRNLVVDNDIGVFAGASLDVSVEHNLIGWNRTGVSLNSDAANNVVSRNRIVANDGPGVVLTPPGSGTPAHDNEVSWNVVSRNETDGIFVGPGSATRGAGNLLFGNHARGNGDDGIDVEDEATTLARNVASWNGDLGIEAVPGVVDGGGNRASHNGNRAQCLNIPCNPRWKRGS